MIKSQQFESFFGSTQAQEREQIRIRLFIVTLIGMVEVLFLGMTDIATLSQWILLFFTLFYLLSTAIYMTLLQKKEFMLIHWRRDIAMAIDIVSISIGIYLLDAIGTLLTPIYLVVLIGNGLRYGVAMMLKGLLVSTLCIALLIVFNTHWYSNIYLGLSLVVSMAFVTFIVHKILQRLKRYHSQLKNALREVSFLAYHDSLTKLPNRHSFEETLGKWLRQKQPFYLMFIDLDGFKRVNDTYGHERGDAVLVEVAERLKKHLDTHAFIARISGDEFVVMVSKQHISANVLELLLLALRDHYTTLSIDSVSASIGIACFPDDSSEERLLLRYADEAMYDAKRSGKNCYKFHSTTKLGE